MDVSLNNQMSEVIEGKKRIHKPALICGILSIFLGAIIALIGDVLAITGIVLSCIKRKEYKTTAALVCSIIGLIVSIANHVIGYLLVSSMM